MAIYRVEGPDGAIHRFEGPDDATPDQVTAFAAQTFGKKSEKQPEPSGVQAFRQYGPMADLMRAGRGMADSVANIGNNANALGTFMRGNDPVSPEGVMRGEGGAQEIMRKNKEARAESAALPENQPGLAYEGGKFLTDVIATSPAMKLLGAGVSKIPGLAGIGEGIRSFGGAGANLPSRMVGGGVAGGASGAMTDPEHAGWSAGIGAAVPLAAKAASAGGDALANFIRPRTEGGREKIAGGILRNGAEDVPSAIARLKASQEIIPGSAPSSAAASGDFGLAATLNTLQDKIPEVGGAARRAQDVRNIKRMEYAHSMSGDPSTIEAAILARDTITKPMRDAVLQGASPIPAEPMLNMLDRLAASPKTQGRINQDAIKFARDNIERITQNGQIDATALYEIRKDINMAMEGRLSGDAKNYGFARKVLTGVKSMIDDAIDAAAPRAGGNPMLGGGPVRIGQGPQQTGGWKDYLSEYATRSKAIDQDRLMQDVIRRAGGGTLDTAGNPMLFAGKLNTILKNEGQDLAKGLRPDQLDAIRKLAADASADQMAASASKSASGNSVTFKMGSGNQAIDSMMGLMPGGGVIARLLQMTNAGNKEQVMGLLGDSVLNPQLASYLMEQAAPKAARGAIPGAYRGLPFAPGLLFPPTSQ